MALKGDVETCVVNDAVIEQVYNQYLISDYPEHMITEIQGWTQVNDGDVASIAYYGYYKGHNVYISSFYEGFEVTKTIYNAKKDETCTYNEDYPADKEVVKGNSVSLRLLDKAFLEESKKNDDYQFYTITLGNGKEYLLMVLIDEETSHSMVYDLQNRMMVHMNQSFIQDGVKNTILWDIVLIDLTTPVNVTTFEW